MDNFSPAEFLKSYLTIETKITNSLELVKFLHLTHHHRFFTGTFIPQSSWPHTIFPFPPLFPTYSKKLHVFLPTLGKGHITFAIFGIIYHIIFSSFGLLYKAFIVILLYCVWVSGHINALS